MSEGEFWHTQIIVIRPPFHLQNLKPHEAAAKGPHGRGRDGVTEITALNSKTFRKEPEADLSTHAKLDHPFC